MNVFSGFSLAIIFVCFSCDGVLIDVYRGLFVLHDNPHSPPKLPSWPLFCRQKVPSVHIVMNAIHCLVNVKITLR